MTNKIYRTDTEVVVTFPNEKDWLDTNHAELWQNLTHNSRTQLRKRFGELWTNITQNEKANQKRNLARILTNLTDYLEEGDDDFYQISLLDIVISFTSLVTILIMFIQLILRLNSPPPDIEVKLMGGYPLGREPEGIPLPTLSQPAPKGILIKKDECIADNNDNASSSSSEETTPKDPNRKTWWLPGLTS